MAKCGECGKGILAKERQAGACSRCGNLFSTSFPPPSVCSMTASEGKEVTTRCGRKVKKVNGVMPPDVTAWGSYVTCEACISMTDWMKHKDPSPMPGMPDPNARVGAIAAPQEEEWEEF